MTPIAAAACAVLLFTLTPGARAQEAPKRLSDWLLEQPQKAEVYPLGLSWRVPEEVAAQSLLKRDLLQALASVGTEASGRLGEWVGGLPVTGRVPVAVADARWLQANAARDPMLQPHHRVVLPSRPESVTVITDRGARCAVAHASGRGARAYVEACGSDPVDWAWIAQPDGRVQRYGIALWNREAQDEPAPGAWIWAPGRASDWPDKASELLVRFLATQGPAPDEKRGLTPEIVTLTPFTLTPFRVTASDWGDVGLLQTPTARMGRTGSFRFNYSRVQPYSRGNIFVQPFDWLEAGFRYSGISNRLYDPTGALNTGQSAKDKGFDAKFRLWTESAYVPEVAIGLRDLAGTGLFSGEYLVANKRSGDFDWSLGLGWGYIGARGDVRNPLRLASKSFETRKGSTVEGGTFALSSYFRGPAAFFGGVQYQSPWEPLILKVEYDGNDYQHDPQANNQRQRSPWNLGLVYRAARWVDLSLAVERGTTLMFGVTFHTDLDGMQMPKLADPPRVPVAAGRPQRAADWKATGAELARQTDWTVENISRRGRELRVVVDDAAGIHWRERVDRAAAVLHRDAPAEVDRFTLAYRQRGAEVAEHVIDREAWVNERMRPLPPGERRETVVARDSIGEGPEDATLFERRPPAFESRLGMDFQYTLGGPDAFALYQFSAAGRAKLRLRHDTWVSGKLRLGLVNNYDKFKYTAPSNLPRVRTFLREYLTTSAITLPNLQLTHVGKLSANHYYSVYGGLLEEMFAGAGGEWLYRPFASPIAFGIDLNAVRQRDFHQNFAFRDYRTVTGHATWYWNTGWHDMQVNISAGRYLAKDAGATLELSRTFRNGVAVGAFATKTNVSAARFGEGSFDKGVYLSIPFDVMLTRSSSSVGSFLWKPLTRDGGARLTRAEPLYSITSLRDERTLLIGPAPKPNEISIPADRREPWSFAPTGPAPYVQVPARAPAAAWTKDARLEHALVQALYAQQFRNIDVAYGRSQQLTVALSHESLRPASLAIGRAVRTALRLAPLEVREIRVTLSERAEPVVSYDFIDLKRLEQFLRGEIGSKELQDMVAVEWHNPAMRESDPLARLRDLETIDATPRVADLLPDARPAKRLVDDVVGAEQIAAGADWLTAGAIGAGMVLASAVLDKRAFRFATDHAGSRWVKGPTKVGNALPWIGMGAAALAALDGSDPRRSRIGYAAAEAGAISFLAATGLKYAVGRARPDAGLGSGTFRSFSADDRYQAFPSRHAAVAWAVATPFAREYGADWLYGAAAITTLARVGSREHWVSDAVAGSLLGYAVGHLFHEASRTRSKGAPRVLLERNGIKLAWALD